mmetsp:Transcript_4743/g.11761  ORF Transcript_4743/g.11761 Transcript_4743/m.11761 type:complete len:329 (-) Transcript_4743:81-1067(-)
MTEQGVRLDSVHIAAAPEATTAADSPEGALGVPSTPHTAIAKLPAIAAAADAERMDSCTVLGGEDVWYAPPARDTPAESGEIKVRADKLAIAAAPPFGRPPNGRVIYFLVTAPAGISPGCTIIFEFDPVQQPGGGPLAMKSWCGSRLRTAHMIVPSGAPVQPGTVFLAPVDMRVLRARAVSRRNFFVCLLWFAIAVAVAAGVESALSTQAAFACFGSMMTVALCLLCACRPAPVRPLPAAREMSPVGTQHRAAGCQPAPAAGAPFGLASSVSMHHGPVEVTASGRNESSSTAKHGDEAAVVLVSLGASSGPQWSSGACCAGNCGLGAG